MSMESKLGKQEKGSNGAEKIVVAVKASKEIPKTALVWALTHVVQPGHCITLLVVIPSQSSGRKLWGFPVFAGDCASGHKRSHPGGSSDQKTDISDSYSQMILRLHDLYDADKVKVVYGCGAVAAEAKRIQASWVILDKQLKHEEKLCMEELQCNVVVMTKSKPKVLRVNLVGSSKKEPEADCTLPSKLDQLSDKQRKSKSESLRSVLGLVGNPTSSPELFTATEAGTSSLSSSDSGTSPFSIPEINGSLKETSLPAKEDQDSDEPSSDTDSENLSASSPSLGYPLRVSDIVTSPSRSGLGLRSWMADMASSHCRPFQQMEENSQSSNKRPQTSTKYGHDVGFSGNVREAISLIRNSPSAAPPLCSICQHKAPVFGKPPKWFTYAELALATGGFSRANFLAEGGFGSVHRGVLPNGQAVAIKQHKLAGSQGDQEFCSEVEVLSCAQHRNVVMLIGFCVEDGRRLLVYEYICNRSLDSHLYGRHRDPLEWSARQKIAVGAARGLRYLHEECRVGCIVHRDMRPNNILITHDFEPLVGDFGLARWQKDGDNGVETRVIGTFGYLAPEYAQSGQITEKADVYSFGVVLVELVTGRKAVDLNRPKGQQCLTEWARPLMEEYAVDELVDPRLGNCYSEHEVYCMLHAASLCIRQDPHSRPRMSQVLRILEGDMFIDLSHVSTPGFEVGTSRGSFCPDQDQQQQQERYTCDPIVKEALEGFSRKLCIDTMRHGFWERDKAGKGSRGDNL